MTEPRFLPGSWADVCRDGTIVYSRGREIVVGPHTDAPDDRVIAAPEELLFVRADKDDAGRLLVAGKGSDDQCYWWTELTGWTPDGPTKGNYSVEVNPIRGGWRLYAQRTSFTFDELILTHTAEGGLHISRETYDIPTDDPDGSAQGFLDATDPDLVFTDRSRQVGATVKPVSAGPFFVGQDSSGLDRVILSTADGYPLRVLYDGWTDSPRAAWVNGRVIMASNSKHGVVIAEGRPEDFPLYTVPQPPPKPDPQPQPEPEPIPVDIPNYLDDVEALAAQYPTEFAEAHHPELGDDRAYAFIRRLAARLFVKDKRIGLCWKRGSGPLGWDSLTVLDGTATQPGSRVVAVIDVIGGAGGPNPTPTWGSVEIAGATWVRPDAVEPGPDPQKPPPVVTPPPPKVKSREQFAAEFRQVNDFYASEDGLQRPGGMVIDGGCDVVAMIQWGHDLMSGAKLEDVINAIRGSHEYQTKHGA